MSTAYATIGALLMLAVITIGTISSWRAWRHRPSDGLRSGRLKNLSTVIFGAWLLFAVGTLIVTDADTPPPLAATALFIIFLALPFAAVAVWLVGHATHNREQREARKRDQALGLAVAPYRRPPTTLALWYSVGYVTALPLVLTALLFALFFAAHQGLPDPFRLLRPGATVLPLVWGIAVLYLAIAGVHITHRWWIIRREKRQARQANLANDTAKR